MSKMLETLWIHFLRHVSYMLENFDRSFEIIQYIRKKVPKILLRMSKKILKITIEKVYLQNMIF